MPTKFNFHSSVVNWAFIIFLSHSAVLCRSFGVPSLWNPYVDRDQVLVILVAHEINLILLYL